MSKFGLEYREETGYDVGVYCEDIESENSIFYYHEHYVEWLEQKIEALSQPAVIKNEVAVCENDFHNLDVSRFGICDVCKSDVKN
jgi:hypothetical protein